VFSITNLHETCHLSDGGEIRFVPAKRRMMF
jgi:hypothetical protein